MIKCNYYENCCNRKITKNILFSLHLPLNKIMINSSNALDTTTANNTNLTTMGPQFFLLTNSEKIYAAEDDDIRIPCAVGLPVTNATWTKDSMSVIEEQ